MFPKASIVAIASFMPGHNGLVVYYSDRAATGVWSGFVVAAPATKITERLFAG